MKITIEIKKGLGTTHNAVPDFFYINNSDEVISEKCMREPIAQFDKISCRGYNFFNNR